MENYGDVKNTFLQNLINHCEETNFSVEEIAMKLKKDKENLKKIFQGSRDYYSEDLIFQMAIAANASPYKIFTLGDPPMQKE